LGPSMPAGWVVVSLIVAPSPGRGAVVVVPCRVAPWPYGDADHSERSVEPVASPPGRALDVPAGRLPGA
jgi:hypothetical protein